MRIRKHASKILGTASSVALQLPSSPPPSSAVGLLQPYYLCELNRSPWDVLPFPPLTPRPPLDRPPNPKMEEEEDEGNVGNEIKEEPMSVIASKKSFGSDRTMRKDEYDDEEHDNEKQKKKKRRRRSTDDVKKPKRRVKKDMGVEARSPGVVITCKKTDGKKWRCKRPAHHPNSFCHYHLTQLRSYSYTANNNRVPTSDSDESRRRRVVSPTASTVKDSGSFYYYSPFGPWRGKRRGGDSAQTVAPADEEEKEVEEQQEEEPDDGNVVDVDVVVDDVDDEEDDNNSEGENGMDEKKRKHKRNTRKKGRKPVKARSLKSLL